jgi:hypothetical protein
LGKRRWWRWWRLVSSLGRDDVLQVSRFCPNKVATVLPHQEPIKSSLSIRSYHPVNRSQKTKIDSLSDFVFVRVFQIINHKPSAPSPTPTPQKERKKKKIQRRISWAGYGTV